MNTGAPCQAPPGLEGKAGTTPISPLEELLKASPGHEKFIEAIRDAVLKDMERSVQERTEALWAKGKQVFHQAQQKHREEVQQLMEEVNRCHERHKALAAENEQLREALHSIISKCAACSIGASTEAHLLSPSSTFAGTSPSPSDPDTSHPSRPFTPSPYTPAVDYYSNEAVILPEVPPMPFSGAPGAPAPLSLAEALAAPPAQRTPVCLADSLNAPAAKTEPSPGDEGAKHVSITITKTAEQEWGLDVSHEEDGKVGLRVDGLRKGGVVEAWNQQQSASGNPDKAVLVGDLITRCNGVFGPKGILEECVSQQKLSLSILREVSASPKYQLRADASEFVPGES